MQVVNFSDVGLGLQQFSFKPATTQNIKPIAGLRPATLFVAHLIGNCCKLKIPQKSKLILGKLTQLDEATDMRAWMLIGLLMKSSIPASKQA